jgi:uracil-DNA glycosylase
MAATEITRSSSDGFPASAAAGAPSPRCPYRLRLTTHRAAERRPQLPDRTIALHADLDVVIAVGSVAQDIVKTIRTSIKVRTTRSPLRSSNAERERIRETFVQARLDAYPLGLDRG